MRTEPLVIERQTGTPDDLGEIVVTWSPYCVAYGHVKPITGREHSLGTAGETLSEVTYRAEVRDDPATRAATSKMRVRWNGRLLYIAAVLESTQRGKVLILLQERPPQS